MNKESILLLEEYITLESADPSMDHLDPRGMSPVPSAASTPPFTTNMSTSITSAAATATAVAPPAPLAISSHSQPQPTLAHHHHHHYPSFPSQPPQFPLPLSAYPRRAEHSYLYQQPSQPYSLGAPPPPPTAVFPKLRAPQLPTDAIMSAHQTSASSSADLQSSLEPDAAPSGTGPARKRPKYTRSKKGCLTCRSKKIKCDERKPMCTRCEHGHRECTWPEAVLPRRPKGAVRGVGESNGEAGEDDESRRGSIPGSAVSTQFPSSATSTHFGSSGIPTNSPFEPAPPATTRQRDVFDSDVYPSGSHFSIPANTRPFYPRAPGSADFYPVATLNGQPIDDYEFPPRQQQQQQPQQPFGSSSGHRGGNGYTNGALYATGPPGAVPNYNGDLRRASWDSSAPTDGRRPSWDTNSMGGGAHASSVSSPASSTLGLGLGGIPRAGGPSTGNGIGSSSGSGQLVHNNGLMLLHSPDPLSPFFRSVQERNLVGNLSSFDPSSSSSSSFFLSSSSSLSSSPSSSSSLCASSASSHFSTTISPASYDASTIPTGSNLSASSPVISNASSADFGITADGVAYRKNSYPHLFAPLQPQPLTIDPPAPIVPQGIVDLRRPSVDLLSLAEKTGQPSSFPISSDDVEWLAPPSLDVTRPPFSSPEEEPFGSWSAYS